MNDAELAIKLDRVMELQELQTRQLGRMEKALFGNGTREFGRGPVGLLGQVDRNTAWIMRSSRLIWIGAAAVAAALLKAFWPGGD